MKSKILFQNQFFVVCLTSAGLSVQHEKKGSGKLLPPDGEGFADWVEAFETAIDRAESHLLAHYFYHTSVTLASLKRHNGVI